MNLLRDLLTVKANLQEDDFAQQTQDAPTAGDTDDKDGGPKVIAKADEYRVELDDDEQVHLLNGHSRILVSMPLVVWKQLCRAT